MIGPVLNEARYWHGCIDFVENGTTYIMVSGGMGAGYKKSVEILDASNVKIYYDMFEDVSRGKTVYVNTTHFEGDWEYGTPLPYNIWMHNMVSWEDRVYVVGGVDTYDVRKSILQYQAGVWKEIESALKVGRAQTLTIQLTDEQADEFCHCDNPRDGDPDFKFARSIVNTNYHRCTRYNGQNIVTEREKWGKKK